MDFDYISDTELIFLFSGLYNLLCWQAANGVIVTKFNLEKVLVGFMTALDNTMEIDEPPFTVEEWEEFKYQAKIENLFA